VPGLEKNVTVRVGRELYEAARFAATVDRTTVQALVEKGLSEVIERRIGSNHELRQAFETVKKHQLGERG